MDSPGFTPKYLGQELIYMDLTYISTVTHQTLHAFGAKIKRDMAATEAPARGPTHLGGVQLRNWLRLPVLKRNNKLGYNMA